MTQLIISLLGPFNATADGEPIGRFRTNRVQALLAYLAVESGRGVLTHRRDGIAELLWPGMPTSSALQNLRNTLYELKKITPDHNGVSFLEATRKTLQVNLGYSLSVDTGRFADLLAHHPDHWQEAVDLYRGDFLADFQLPDGATFELWASERRSDYRRQVLDALTSLVDMQIERQAYGEADRLARRQINIDPLREKAYQQLMTVLAFSGKRAEALRQFDICKQQLDEQLAVPVSQETEKLAQTIRAEKLPTFGRTQTNLGGYDLKEMIGSGNFGSVYRGIQTSIGREVAVKIIRDKYANDPDFIRQFEVEAQTIARLEHPHIVPLYDFWREPGSAYLVMRWLRGGSLADQLEQGKGWTVERAMPLVQQVGQALHVAHGRGIIHRDIKPANILLDDAGNGYLSDFGISSSTLGAIHGESGPMTPAEMLLSATSMSPEQVSGRAITKASDIYSFGILLYQLLTGRHPFTAESPVHLAQLHVTQPLPSLLALRPGLSQEIDNVIQHATAKRPEDRYRSILELVQAFQDGVSKNSNLCTNGRLNLTGKHLLTNFEEHSADRSIITARLKNNLPPQLTRFLGRHNELEILNRFLVATDIRLITIQGAGGMGKTRLALNLTKRYLTSKQFPNGIYFVSLAHLSDSDQIVPSIAEALSFPLETGGEQRRTVKQQIFDYLCQKKILLLLDNFEHLLSGVELVADILQKAPLVKILVTSRERLRLHQEQLFTLHGLEIPQIENLDDLEKVTAVQLFLQSAKRVKHDFQLREEDKYWLTCICHLVEGMPLAVELAAGWVDTLTLSEIADEIQKGLDLFETEALNVPMRQRSIRAIFNSSWKQLSQTEQNALAHFSIFRGGFSRNAAQAISNTSLRTLSKLINKLLLQFDQSRERYTIHELLRQYAAEQLLKDEANQTSICQTHSNYYLNTLAEQKEKLQGSEQQTTLVAIEADIENGRVAWQWATDHKEIALLATATDSMGYWHEWRGRYQEGETLFRTAAEAIKSIESPEAFQTRAKLLAWQSSFINIVDGVDFEGERATELCQQALALLQSNILATTDSRHEEAFVLYQMGRAGPNYNKKKKALEKSLALWRELGDRWGIANTLQILGTPDYWYGGIQDFETNLAECFTLRKELKDHRGIAQTMILLSTLLGHQGRFMKALPLAEEAVQISRNIGNLSTEARGLFNLGISLYRVADFEKSATTFDELIRLSKNFGDINGLAEGLYGACTVMLALGQFEQAQSYAGSFNETPHMGSQWILGEICLIQKQFDEAAILFQKTLAFSLHIKNKMFIGINYSYLSAAEFGRGQIGKAQHFAYQAAEIGVKTHHFLTMQFGFASFVLLFSENDCLEYAIELDSLYRSHQPHFDQAWNWKIRRQPFTERIAHLPSKVIKAARVRGRQLDYWESAEALLAKLKTMGWRNLENTTKPNGTEISYQSVFHKNSVGEMQEEKTNS